MTEQLPPTAASLPTEALSVTEPLHPDTALGVRLSAICANGQFAVDPRPVIDELRATAGDRVDVLAREAGTWAGYHDDVEESRPLVDALLEFPGARRWADIGRSRRVGGRHNTIDPRQRPSR